MEGGNNAPKKQVFLREDFPFKAKKKIEKVYPFSTRWGVPRKSMLLYKGSDTAENTPEVPKHVVVRKECTSLCYISLFSGCI